MLAKNANGDALVISARAMSIYQQEENEEGMAGQVAFRGVVLELMGQFEPALEAQLQALEFPRRTNDLSGAAAALFNLVEIHRKLGDNTMSLASLDGWLLHSSADQNSELHWA